jgi:hypothetical protein
MSMEWLKPFMTERKHRRGDRLFRKGDKAAEMFLTVTGKFLANEIGVEHAPERIMGELSFLTPNNQRTMTIECREDGGPVRTGQPGPMMLDPGGAERSPLPLHSY